LVRMIDVDDHDDAGLRGQADQRDDSHPHRRREPVVEQPHQPDTADEREWNRQQDDQHLDEVPKLQEQKQNDDQQRDGHDDLHARQHLSELLVLTPAECRIVGTFELDPDREIVAALASLPRRAPRMPRPVHTRNELDQLAAADFRSVVLCTGYLGEQIQRTFGETYKCLRILYSQEPKPLGTGGALRFALPQITSDPVLVLNGDSFCGIDLKSYVRWHGDRRATASIVLTRVLCSERYGSVKLEPKFFFARKEHESEKTTQS